MPAKIVIEKPKQLLVEGAVPKAFFEALLAHLHLQDIQLQNYGGINELKGFLKALSITPGFNDENLTVTKLAIIRDAETDFNAAMASVNSALQHAHLTEPNTSNSTLRISVYILPDHQNAGMLETLCLASVNSKPELKCVAEYINCLTTLGIVLPNPTKSQTAAYLATTPRPDFGVGHAARAKYWDWDHPTFEALKSFLKSL